MRFSRVKKKLQFPYPNIPFYRKKIVFYELQITVCMNSNHNEFAKGVCT